MRVLVLLVAVFAGFTTLARADADVAAAQSVIRS